MTEPLVTYALEGEVALVGLNRDDVRNAINAQLLDELRDQVLRACEEARAGVIFSHGEQHFSAGLDLASVIERSKMPPPRLRRRSNWHTTFDLISRDSIPWVSALKGATVGGGLELAASTHIRVADESTFFALPEAQRGIFVGGAGSVNIQRLMGYARMADMMLTGLVMSAQEALDANVVQYLVPANESLEKAKQLAVRIAENPPMVNWGVTAYLSRTGDMSHDDGMFAESLLGANVRSGQTTPRIEQFLEGEAAPIEAPTDAD